MGHRDLTVGMDAVNNEVERICTFNRIISQQLQSDVEDLLRKYKDLTGHYPESLKIEMENSHGPDVVVSMKSVIHQGASYAA